MRVAIAGWTGSTNLGDELVLAGLRVLLAERGVTAHALSRAPEATEEAHGLLATGDTDLSGTRRLLRSADAVVFGGGGLVQDETSPFNLPYHLSRTWLARAVGTPWAGIGLGAGPLTTGIGRGLARTLRSAVGLSVRDPYSAEVLRTARVRDVTVASDLALHLPRPTVEAEDVATVSLRFWSGSGGSYLPVAMRRTTDETPAWFIDEAATALDSVADRTGLSVRLVALQTDRDHEIHERVAERMHNPADLRVPTLDTVVDEIARGRVVVAMRYHAAIAATLAGRPVVGIGYSPKVEGLVSELGRGAQVLRWAPGALAGLPGAIDAVRAYPDEIEVGYAALVERGRGNHHVLDHLLDTAAANR